MHDLKEHFIDAVELTRLLNRSLTTVHFYRKTGKIPAPTAKLNTVFLWDRKEIEHWYAENNDYYALELDDIEPANDPCFYCEGV